MTPPVATSLNSILNVMRCAIWYDLYNLKNVKNIHGGMLLLVKLQAEACNFTKSNIPPWVFFTFFCGGTILSNEISVIAFVNHRVLILGKVFEFFVKIYMRRNARQEDSS